MVERYGENTSTHSLVDTDLWTHVAGGARKGCIYGVGEVRNTEFVQTSSQNPYANTGRSYISGGSASFDEVQQLRQQVDELKEANDRMQRGMEKMEERIQKEVDEMIQREQGEIEQQMDDKMRAMMNSLISGVQKNCWTAKTGRTKPNQSTFRGLTVRSSLKNY